VSYLDGADVFDRDEDGNTAELRAHRLGDIFHSSPIAIGPPSLYLSGEQGFGPSHDSTSFLAQYRERDRIRSVGANDGMLHAFEGGESHTGDNPATSETENGYYDLGNGDEAFGYVPGLLLDQIKFIPRNLPRSYYFVDGTPAAADVWIPSSSGDTSKEAKEWATALVTGMRQGGSGYLALDVTDPDASSGDHGPYPKLLWEIDESVVPLGEAWSEPVITRVKIKQGTLDMCGKNTMDDGPCREQWVAIFAGGYREDGNPNHFAYVSDPNSPQWSNRSKGLFMVAMDTGALIAQATFDPNSSVLSQMRYSIPTTPAVLDLDFDGFADVVYAGDLGGQMWRWDLTEVGDDEDNPNDGVIDNWKAGLFFKSDPAVMSAGGLHYHSIFFPPVATYLNGELVLAFGSGERTDLRYEGTAQGNLLEGKDDDNNRFWVVWDRTPLGADPDDSSWYTVGEGHETVNGQKRGLNEATGLATDNDPDDDGYFIKLPDGEKFITNHILFAGILMTLSYVPNDDAVDICNNVGSTNIWIFNLEDAGALLDAAAGADFSNRRLELGPGIPTDPRITVSKNKVVLIGQTSLGNVFEYDVPAEPPPPIELVFWRQIF
jgi:type IV pilus assembly protein PilY1